MAVELHKNIVVEPVGDDLLVCDLKGSTVAMLSGSHADVVRAVIAGDEVPASLTHLLDELITRGVLRDTSASSLFSRRKALGLAAGAAGAGFLTLAMPQVAVAASGCTLAPAVNIADPGGGNKDVSIDLGENTCGFTRIQFSFVTGEPFTVTTFEEVVDDSISFVTVLNSNFPVFIRGVLPSGGVSNVFRINFPSS